MRHCRQRKELKAPAARRNVPQAVVEINKHNDKINMSCEIKTNDPILLIGSTLEHDAELCVEKALAQTNALNMAKLLPERSLWPARKNWNQLRALLEPERHEFVANFAFATVQPFSCAKTKNEEKQ